MTVPFDDLRRSCPDGLSVIARDDDGYMDAISARAFILNLPSSSASSSSSLSDDRYPDGVIKASTTEAVQAVVRFCRLHNLRVSVRTGGHNWFTVWLQGRGTVILDVGDLDKVEDVVVIDGDKVNIDGQLSATVIAGPGVKDLNKKIQPDWFFPTGHCPQVPLGGFILGGGFGVGFQKYGMACARVVAMEVVMASGDIRWVSSDDTDLESQALMDLMRGSYHYFPAVVTKYKLRLCRYPKCVIPQTLVFSLDDWQLAVKYGRNIAHRGDDDDSSSVETTVVFCYSPPEIFEATGLKKVVLLSLMAWSDEDETSTRQLLMKYTSNVQGLLLPSTADQPVEAHKVADSFGGLYPQSRYLVEASCGDSSSILNMSDDDVCKLLLPLAKMWMSDDIPESPWTHSLVVLMNKNLKSINGCDLATGYVPGIEVMTYAVYQNELLDSTNRELIQRGMNELQKSNCCHTALVEGDILNRSDSFAVGGKERMDEKIRLVDPDGLFDKRMNTNTNAHPKN